MNKQTTTKETSCYFCVNNAKEIDYKDVQTLLKFVNIYKKVLPQKRTCLCSWHQRKMTLAIKRARNMALLPFTGNR